MLWPGSGYCLCGPFSVSSDLLEKDNLEYAVELLAARLIQDGDTAFYLTVEEYDNLCKECGYNSEDGDDMEGYLYVDGTMEGAPYPVYLCTENLSYQFTN